MHSTAPGVTVVGAGLAGAACAAALQRAGVAVTVLDRGRAPGGRLASPELHGRRVDLGAGYFTVRDEGFRAVVQTWAGRGLAREWTDTFSVLTLGQEPSRTSGPMRWATPHGLRSLVRDVLADVEVRQEQPVDTLPEGHVVLAMPDPQASRLTGVDDAVAYDPVLTVACGFGERSWSFTDAAFVHDHPVVEFVADDGARRGDQAAVLVVHTTAAFAGRHLDDPDAAIEPVAAGLTELAGTATPSWTSVHRWTYAKPAGKHPSTHGLVEDGGRLIGLAGDQWCPDGAPRVESAWRSGSDLAAGLLRRL